MGGNRRHLSEPSQRGDRGHHIRSALLVRFRQFLPLPFRTVCVSKRRFPATSREFTGNFIDSGPHGASTSAGICCAPTSSPVLRHNPDRCRPVRPTVARGSHPRCSQPRNIPTARPAQGRVPACRGSAALFDWLERYDSEATAGDIRVPRRGCQRASRDVVQPGLDALDRQQLSGAQRATSRSTLRRSSRPPCRRYDAAAS